MTSLTSHSLVTTCLIFVSVFSAAAQSSGPRVDLSLEGPQVFFARSEDDLLNNAVPQLLAYLRAPFLITYQSASYSSRKGFHKVELKLDSPNSEKPFVITPRGYFFPGNPPPAKEKKQ